MKENGETAPARLLDTITTGVIAFCGIAKPADDMTMMLVSRRPADA